jgi:hypothetical protein
MEHQKKRTLCGYSYAFESSLEKQRICHIKNISMKIKKSSALTWKNSPLNLLEHIGQTGSGFWICRAVLQSLQIAKHFLFKSHTLKYFQTLFWIRWEINENVLIPRYVA